MSVIVDATSAGSDAGIFGTQISSTNMTVGTSLNRVLVTGFAWLFDPGPITVTWDFGGSNQVMSLVASSTNGSVISQLFGLVNPISGNKTLHASWTNDSGTNTASFDSISFGGAHQAGGTRTFYNATNTIGAGATSSLTINASPDDYVIEAISNGSYNGLISTDTTAMYHIGAHPGGGMSYGKGKTGVSVVWDTATHGWADVAVAIASTPNFSFNMAGI